MRVSVSHSVCGVSVRRIALFLAARMSSQRKINDCHNRHHRQTDPNPSSLSLSLTDEFLGARKYGTKIGRR